MTWLLVLVLLFAVAVALFAAQNSQTVDVMFLFWTLHTTLALVILGAALAGAIAAALFGLVTHVRLRLRLRRAELQLRQLQVRPPEPPRPVGAAAPSAPEAPVPPGAGRPGVPSARAGAAARAAGAEGVEPPRPAREPEAGLGEEAPPTGGSEPDDADPDSGARRGTVTA